MRILSKIRALFTHKNEPQEMRLAAAEIRGNKVFVHPLDKPHTTIAIRAAAVDLHINPEGEVEEKDFFLFQKKKREKGEELEKKQAGEKNRAAKQQNNDTPYKTPMKTISFRVYQEEYDAVMSVINENGYRKAEYMLACVHAAKKKSMESIYLQYHEAYQKRRKADREAAKRFRVEQNNPDSK